MLINDSEQARTYQIRATSMAYTESPPLELWETRAAAVGKAFNSRYLKYLCSASADSRGTYSVTVEPYSIVTVTTRTSRSIVANSRQLRR